jgi:mono/diheme cytochrome c family protein
VRTVIADGKVRLLGVALVVATAGLATGMAQGPPQRPLAIESLTGRDNYAMYCSSCHGAEARGDGPVAAALTVRPSDLTVLARQNGGVFPRARVASFITGPERESVRAHGSAGMPAWGPIFSALDTSDQRARQRLDNVVRYLESIQSPSAAVNDLGSRLFRTHCATCHGGDGRGAGPMANQLRRTPPDLTRYAARNGGLFPSEKVRRIIDGRDVPSHGIGDMPVWGDVFRKTDDATEATVRARIDAIVRYLEAIQARSARRSDPEAPWASLSRSARLISSAPTWTPALPPRAGRSF